MAKYCLHRIIPHTKKIIFYLSTYLELNSHVCSQHSSSLRLIACDTEMSMQKRVFADEWWKYNWNINRIFHTSRDLPKAIIAALFAFINVFFRTECSWIMIEQSREWEIKLMLLRSDWLTHSFLNWHHVYVRGFWWFMAIVDQILIANRIFFKLFL